MALELRVYETIPSAVECLSRDEALRVLLKVDC